VARPEAFEPDLATSLNTHAATLSALGRREEAEATAREAVGLRRKLAAARPEAFEPYLAGSLNIHANTLSDLGRRENALQASDEAVRLLRPHFLALPSAHQTNMMVMVRVYLRHCRTLNRELDADLLEPILAKLAELGVIKPPE
jgi:tetratricopeptide (TPR) repeat protein